MPCRRTSLVFIGAEVEGTTMLHISSTNRATPVWLLAEFQKYSPISLYMYRAIEYVNRSEALADLRTLKGDFEADLHHGSWFSLSRPLRDAIEALDARTQVSMRDIWNAESALWQQYGREDRISELPKIHSKKRAEALGIPRRHQRWLRFRKNWEQGWESQDFAS